MTFQIEFRERDDYPWSAFGTVNSLVAVMTSLQRLRSQGFLARALNAQGDTISGSMPKSNWISQTPELG